MGNYNIVKDYPWAIGNNVSKEDVPRIRLVQYQQDTGALVQSIKHWVEVVKGRGFVGDGSMKMYEKLYDKEGPINTFTFPFYSDYNHVVTNNWGVAQGALDQLVDKWIVPAAKIGRPSAGVESPRLWQGTTCATYNLTFDLLNTVTEGEEDLWSKNKEFVDVFIKANLSRKESIITALPPSLYEVTVPGIRYSPVAIISNLTVSNVGQNNFFKGAGLNMPDAWRFNIQIQELVVETEQIYDHTAKVSGSVE